MIKQKSFMRLSGGSLGETTFVKSQDGFRVQEKRTVTKGKFKTDPAMESVRDNASEFGRAGLNGKTIRTAINTLVQSAKDNRTVSRLVKALLDVMHSDTVSPPGKRNVVDGNIAKLVNFEFNENSNTKTVFAGDHTAAINRVTGELTVTVPPFIPNVVLQAAPTSATHFEIVSAGAEVDFELNSAKSDTKVSAKLPLDATATAAISNVHALTANSTKPLFLVFGVRFYRHLNGVSKAVSAGKGNALSIVAVSKA